MKRVVLSMDQLEEMQGKLNNVGMATQLCDNKLCAAVRTEDVFAMNAMLLDSIVETPDE